MIGDVDCRAFGGCRDGNMTNFVIMGSIFEIKKNRKRHNDIL